MFGTLPPVFMWGEHGDFGNDDDDDVDDDNDDNDDDDDSNNNISKNDK